MPRASTLDRYALHARIASGGMGSVYFGVLRGSAGFARVVAIKRLHPHLAEVPACRTAFANEARLASRVRHANVVDILDVIEESGELAIVMEYVPGASLSEVLRLLKDGASALPVAIAAALVKQALEGLHAAHEARAPSGERLELVHRDVSPHNLLVGHDGIVRVLDFGVAKAALRAQVTLEGHVKGKLAYMAPEQLESAVVDARTDVFAAGVVLWECLAGRRLFVNPAGETYVSVSGRPEVPALESIRPDVPPALARVVHAALATAPSDRPASARAMADAIASACTLASPDAIATWLRAAASELLEPRTSYVAALEADSASASASVDDPSVADPMLTAHTVDVPKPSVLAPRPRPLDDAPTIADVPSFAESPQSPQSPRARRRAARSVWITAIVVFGVALAFVAVRRGPPSPASPSAPASSSAEREPPPMTASTTAVATAPPAPFEQDVRAPVASTAPASKGPAQVSTTSRGAASAKRPPAGKAATTTRSCDPPYVVDARGIRTYKPECM